MLTCKEFTRSASLNRSVVRNAHNSVCQTHIQTLDSVLLLLRLEEMQCWHILTLIKSKTCTTIEIIQPAYVYV
jgi:hypothetical protein